MIYQSAIVIIITALILMGTSYVLIYNFFKRIYLPYKKDLVDLDFETSLFILRTIINTELDAYENDIFMSKGSITNSNFDNFYKDITTKIIKNLSPDLVKHLSLYITEDAIYVIIARAVKKFLTDKVNGTL